MRYIAANDIVGMVNNTFTDDGVLYHNFPFFESPPPYVVRGKNAIIQANTLIFQRQGKIEAEEPFNFAEGDDFICFQIKFRSPNTGRWLVNDFWLLRAGRIAHCFSFGYPIE